MAQKGLSKKVWLIAIVVILVIWLMTGYNSLVDMQVNADTAWADVEVQYQRRADLVPQLVSTVKGAANFEQETLTKVTEARTNWLNTKTDANATRGEQIAAANDFDSALSRLLVTVEAYPNITATENFQTLQAQLEGTENRVSVARRDYNNIVKPYNAQIRKFPSSLIAAVFSFDKYDFFESDDGTEKAPEVKFDE